MQRGGKGICYSPHEDAGRGKSWLSEGVLLSIDQLLIQCSSYSYNGQDSLSLIPLLTKGVGSENFLITYNFQVMIAFPE